MYNEGKVRGKLHDLIGIDLRQEEFLPAEPDSEEFIEETVEEHEELLEALDDGLPSTHSIRSSEIGDPKVHYIIPDTQCKPGVDIEYLIHIGRHIREVKPDVVVMLGDWWDMPSLSSYDSGVRKAAEGRCKRADIEAGNFALEVLTGRIPEGTEKVMLMGNHDCFGSQGRVGRYLQEHPSDRGLLTESLFKHRQLGWQVVPFLKQVVIDGIRYSHLFPYNAQGQCVAHASLEVV